jgi:hypothetical protein
MVYRTAVYNDLHKSSSPAPILNQDESSPHSQAILLEDPQILDLHPTPTLRPKTQLHSKAVQDYKDNFNNSLKQSLQNVQPKLLVWNIICVSCSLSTVDVAITELPTVQHHGIEQVRSSGTASDLNSKFRLGHKLARYSYYSWYSSAPTDKFEEYLQ